MASISAATSLATFPKSHASSSRLPHITLNPVYGDDGQLAVAAVQGDGVWTYHLISLRPTASFSVPPSTIFSTRPISFYPNAITPASRRTKEKQKARDDTRDLDGQAGDVSGHERITIIGVQKGEKVKHDHEGKVLWVWRGEDGDKEVIILPFLVHSIHHLEQFNFSVLCVSTTGDIVLLDQSIEQHIVSFPSSSHQGSPADIVAVRMIPKPGAGLNVVLVDSRGFIQVLRLDNDDQSVITAQQGVDGWIGRPGESHEISCADIGEDGVITALDASHHLMSRSIHDFSTVPPLQLSHFKHAHSDPIILSLPSAGRPLVLISTIHPSPSILLTASSSTIPAALAVGAISSSAPAASIIDLSIIAPPKSNSFLVGSVLSHKSEEGESGRCVIYLSEVTLPSKGVGMSTLLGRQAMTSDYLSLGGSESKEHAESGQPFEELVSKLEKILEEPAQLSQAQGIWASWLNTEETKHRKRGQEFRELLSEPTVKRLLGTVFGAALTEMEHDRDDAPKRIERTGRYAPRIVKDLLQRRLLTDAMWPGGVVVGALLPCGDWDNIHLALQQIQTISSSTVVRLVREAVHSAPTRSSKHRTRLTELLHCILALPTPSPTYRLDLRKSLPVEDAAMVLEELTTWAEMHVERRLEGLSSWAPEEGAEMKMPRPVTPSLESVIMHSTILLDSYLPLFLSYAPSHDSLLRLQAALEPLIATQNEFRQLRAPIDAVLTLARREQRKREERQAKRAVTRAIERPIWGKAPGAKARIKERQRKEALGEKEEEMGLPVPEEMVGKWRVEEIVF